MDERAPAETPAEHRSELWGTAILAAVCLLIGVPVLLGQLQGLDIVSGPPWLWWACYAGYVGAFIATFWPHPISWLTPPRAVAVMAAFAVTLVLLAPQGWTAVLLVFTTGTAAHVTSARATVAIAATNCGVLLLSAPLVGAPLWEAAFGAAMYGGLQALTVWAVWLQRREATGREQLAVANTELRAATALLAESSRSAERLRIARELHDVVGHQLTALSLELEAAAHRTSPPALVHVTRARGLAKDLLADVRGAVGELRARPPLLREALADMTRDLPRPRVHLDVDDAVELDEDRVAALIRCTQEIVTNAIRHAEATSLWIEIRPGRDGVVALHARDDGRGASILRLGNGLTGMRERVEALGGTVAFETRAGFRVDAEIPGRRPSRQIADAHPVDDVVDTSTARPRDTGIPSR